MGNHNREAVDKTAFKNTGIKILFAWETNMKLLILFAVFALGQCASVEKKMGYSSPLKECI